MLTKKGAFKLLKNVHFPGEENVLRDLKLAAGSKQSRQALIRKSRPSSERSSAAAIELQRVWRGYWTRCRLYEILNPSISTKVQQTGSRFLHSEQGLRDVRTTPSKSPNKSGSKIATIPSKESVHSKVSAVKTVGARQRLEMYYEKYCQRKKSKGEADIVSFEEFCAHYIQNWWHRVRRQRSVIATQPSSSHQGVRSITVSLSSQPSQTQVSPLAVRVQPKKKKRKKKPRTYPLDPKEAAKMIQRAWRRHIDVQVYRYYRDLINFRCRGDPSMMLRCINPKEAKILDAASGIHVKFRLAGDKFPPNIYYKIFTHRNIVDMCANSPKDYTAASAKHQAAKDIHNNLQDFKTKRDGTKQDAQEGWYKRIENNGWRLVSDRLMLRPEQDPVTWETSNKKVDFPHTKLQRRQDIEKKKKQRKVEWMKKMYREGMLQAKTDDSETKSLIEGAAAGMVAAMESQGSEVVEEWEVDELLEWTSGLNFDDYLTSWQQLATSSGSEKHVEDRLKFETSSRDPFEFSIMLDSITSVPSPSRLTSLQPPKTTPPVSVQ